MVTFIVKGWKMAAKESLPIEVELRIAKEGYIFAQQHKDNWIAGVNNCQYGPANPNHHNLRAEAWYYGWWFYFYIIKPWIDVCKMQ
jgi:hypothetical protein